MSQSIQKTAEVQQQTPVPSHGVDVVTTASGGDGVAQAAARGGALVGIESEKKRPPHPVSVEFVDWPFTKDGACWERPPRCS